MKFRRMLEQSVRIIKLIPLRKIPLIIASMFLQDQSLWILEIQFKLLEGEEEFSARVTTLSQKGVK